MTLEAVVALGGDVCEFAERRARLEHSKEETGFQYIFFFFNLNDVDGVKYDYLHI